VAEGLNLYAVEPDCIYMEGLTRCPPGTYFVVLRGETRTLTEKVVVGR